MTIKKPAAPARPMPTIVEHDDGTVEAIWPVRTIRFMFNDGRTVDIVTTRDDSDLRGVLLKHYKADAIVGSTTISPSEPVEGSHPET